MISKIVRRSRMKIKLYFKRQVFALIFLGLTGGCTKVDPTYSLLEDGQTFHQNNEGITTTMDILWVIDNSGSMETSQNNIASNFNSFIADFKELNYDYQIAITTTDAFKGQFDNDPSLSEFRDGTDATAHTGIRVITPETPDLESVFITNVIQGIGGHGNERAFQSFQDALLNPANQNFYRPNSFLAVIIVSDEDDFSHDTDFWTEDYSFEGLHEAAIYKDFLDQHTASTDAVKRYNVSSMAIFDQDCWDTLTGSGAVWKGRKIATRYEALTDLTDGIKGSLCGNFAQEMGLIANRIIQLATQFYLDREPIESSIKVFVNDNSIPKYDATENPDGGWSYNAETQSIFFHGIHIPAQASVIKVRFDPVRFD